MNEPIHMPPHLQRRLESPHYVNMNVFCFDPESCRASSKRR
jgi:hypothetical protein